MAWTETAPGVFYGDGPTIRFSAQEIAFLVSHARANTNRRARICAHPTLDDPVHEMLICLLDDGYIRPHRHAKYESLHVIEGACDLVLFDQMGQIEDVMRLGTQPDDLLFARLAPGTFHTLCIRTRHFVFHETARGPFDRADTEYASWAPPENDTDSSAAYLAELEAAITRFSRPERGER